MDDKSLARRKSYQNTFSQFGETPQALQYDTYKAQAKRFKQLVADVDITNKTVLDAGCGMGDLVPFLYSRSLNFDYLGVDITPEFIEIAKKRYAGETVAFKVFNPFEDEVDQRYDIVISSGVMNFKTPGWVDKRKKMIERLYGYANEALVFNMAGWMQESAEGEKRIAYVNIPDMLAFCSLLTPKIVLRNQYHARDFTMVMYK